MKAMNAKQDRVFYGDNISIVGCDEDCTRFHLKDETGEGHMTAYRVFPGVRLIYNEIRMGRCQISAVPPEGIIEINHCRSGRIECLFDNGAYLYMEGGDLSVNIKDGTCHASSFPTDYYSGISIEIDLAEAPGCLCCVLDDIYIDFEKLIRVLHGSGSFFVIRNMESFDHIFSELYSVPEKIRTGYFKIKVLEILLFLCGMDLDSALMPHRYYPRQQVETVKAVKTYLTAHLDQHMTLPDLSKKFDISLTQMKKCFRDVFGVPIYGYLRSCRMHRAGKLLRRTDETVMEIAGQVGYDNASKFAAAFKTVMGRTPTQYRRSCARMDQQKTLSPAASEEKSALQEGAAGGRQGRLQRKGES